MRRTGRNDLPIETTRTRLGDEQPASAAMLHTTTNTSRRFQLCAQYLRTPSEMKPHNTCEESDGCGAVTRRRGEVTRLVAGDDREERRGEGGVM